MECVIKLRSFDNSSSKPRRPAACSRDPEILRNNQDYCTGVDRNGSRGQAAGRRELNCQQTLLKIMMFTGLFFTAHASFALSLLDVVSPQAPQVKPAEPAHRNIARLHRRLLQGTTQKRNIVRRDGQHRLA